MGTRTATRKDDTWMYVKEPSRLRRRRKDKGISQVQLAALARCTQQYISLIENGDDRDISEKIAERICKYLDVEFDDYFEERATTPAVATPTRGSRTVAA